ncbi:Uncharacterized protein dnm_008270 [Desulfonema magnum]|uniref:Uncharacterized protein n=1 Tax=Desulfonema magnum TaxID=45655 RepID=A0A975BG66_9BACT|nr:Uncharacterized protein dnm_008270 [Desulfonema magnum]
MVQGFYEIKQYRTKNMVANKPGFFRREKEPRSEKKTGFLHAPQLFVL